MADTRYISDRVKKQLYALSGNECANPLCHNKLVFSDNNDQDDQICHIEAASPDSPRYNPNQTDDERRGFDNLILLCHRCHDLIDHNPDIYTVELLKKWKREHIKKYITNNKNKNFHFFVPNGLIARDKETDRLFEGVISNRFFNLIGVGGSGKSSLAYLMMEKHQTAFNEIAYVVVNNHIKDDFIEQINKTLKLKIEKDEGSFSKLIDYLQENYKSDKPNLIVLDINETPDKPQNGEIINTIISNKNILEGWKFLILSRENIDTRNRIEAYNLKNDENIEFLKNLFLSKVGKRYNDFSDFAELFKKIFYNPLLAEQLGLYLSKLPKKKSLEEIKSILRDNKFQNKDLEGIDIQANNGRSAIVNCLANLISYKSETLDPNEKKLLRHFVLWQTDFINVKAIKQLLKGVLDNDLSKTLRNLSDRAIFMTQDTDDGSSAYKLHGILTESLLEQIDISKQDYHTYLNNIEELIIKENLTFSETTNCIANSLLNYDITDISSFWESIIINAKARQSTKEANIPEYATLASIFNNIGLLYDRKGNKKVAQEYYQKARNVYKELSNPNTEAVDNKIICDGNKLINRINECPKGKEGWSKFEEIGSKVFTYLFEDSFRNYKYTLQTTTTDSIFRRDMIVHNTFKESPSFWQTVKNDYKANLIIIDFKNYTNLLDPDQFYNPSKYMNKLAGHFAIVISRCGLTESSKKLQLRLLEEDKLIMCLSDVDLINLINKKMEGQDPLCTLEDMYYTLYQNK